MAGTSTVISTRVDSSLKEASEAISESIGLTLSTAITIFLKRYVAEGGFPFEVKADVKTAPKRMMESPAFEIEAMVRNAVKNSDSNVIMPSVTYFDPDTNQLVTE